jgi:hypothetical protein
MNMIEKPALQAFATLQCNVMPYPATIADGATVTLVGDAGSRGFFAPGE